MGNYSVDIGYGNIKAMSDNGERILFPTFIGTLKRKLDQDIEGFNYVIKVNGREYKVGEYAQIGNTAHRELEKKHQLDDEKVNVFIGTALNLISKDLSDIEEINLALGLPVDFYDEQKTELEAMLKNAQIRTEFRGKVKTFIVKKLSISQQGVAAFRALYYKENGEKRQASNIKEDAFYLQGGGLIDVGYNTVDFVKIRKLNSKFVLDDEMSVSYELLGSTFAHKRTTRNLNDILGCKNTAAYYESMLKENNGIMFSAGQRIDLNRYFEEGYKDLADELINKLKNLWSKNDLKQFGALYLTGGTAKNIRQYFSIADVDIRLQDDNIYANCIGLLSKLSTRLKKEQKTNVITIKNDEKTAQN